MYSTVDVYVKDGFEALCMAVVKQAAEDFRSAVRHIRRCRHECDAYKDLAEIRDLIDFFESGDVEMLTGSNGYYILQKLKEEARDVVRSPYWKKV